MLQDHQALPFSSSLSYQPKTQVTKHQLAGAALRAVAVLVLVSLSVPRARAQGYMFGRASFPVGSTGTGPASVAIGDFNRDGMMDLAVVQPSRNSVAILLGKIDGTLAAPTYYATAKEPISVVAGDFDGDGRLDLVIGSQNCQTIVYCGSSGSVSVLLGNGDGTFGSPIVVASAIQPGAAVAGDFDGDGKLDLAVINAASGSVLVLLGNGDGSFRSGSPLTPPSAPLGLAVGDFNQDTHLDLAVAVSSGQISIYLGIGDGTFAHAGDSLVLSEPNVVAVGDFNGDGIPDLAVSYAGEMAVSILLGNGDGTFQSHADYSAGTYPVALAIADFNRDGKLDVALANRASQTISILLGKGDGTLQTDHDYLLPGAPTALAASDINRDGTPDLAVVMSDLGVVSIILGQGDGSFPNPTAYGEALGSWGIATGDFTGDGHLDLITTNLDDNSVSVFAGDGAGSFRSNATFPAAAVPVAAVTADFNQDGKVDVAVVNQICTSLPCSPGSVSIFLGNGDGTLEPRTDYSAGSIPVGATTGDFNGDGVPDLAVVNNGFGAGDTITILLGRGDGTFHAGATLTTGSGPSQAVAADFNGDGILDLAVTYTAGFSVFPGRSAGAFGPRTDYAIGVPAKAIATGDFNGDGKPDLAVTTTTGVSIFLGRGDGTLVPGASYAVDSFTSLQGLIVGDFNGDGKADLLVGKQNNAVSILLGNGDGTFLTPVDIAAGISERGWVAGDFDGDGGLDLAATSVGTSSLYVVLNTPVGAVYPAGIEFGQVGVGLASSPHVITLSNPSGAPLEITTVTASGAFSVSSACPSTLAPGMNCTLSVVASPASAGDAGGVITITDNAPASPQSVRLHGTGISVPEISVAPGNLSFGAQNVGSSSAALPVTVTNPGSAALSFAGISASGDFTETDDCVPSVAAGGQCTIQVTFSPTAAGTRTGALTLTDNIASSPQTVGLSGTGVAKPAAGLSATSLTFGNQLINTTSSAESVTLSNTGNATLNITSIDATGGFTASNTCPAALAAGASCTISVSFTPVSTGIVVGALTLTDDAPGSPQAITLTGTGTAPQAALAVSTLNFGGVLLGKSSSVQSVALSNPGTAPLAIGGVVVSGADSGDFALQNQCGTSLTPGSSCSLSVTFSPAAVGTRTALISLTTSAAGSPPTVSLTGAGTAPQASVAPTLVTFNSIMLGTTTGAQLVTLGNPGTATLAISGVTLSGPASGDFALQNQCAASLDPGSNCTMNVTFTPSALGLRTAVVTLSTNAPGSAQAVALTGTGIAPQASLSPGSLTFSSTPLGASASAQAVTLGNPGTAPLTIGGVSITGTASADFALQNQCGASLAPAANCALNLTFTPTAVGTRTAVISVSTNAAGSASTVTLTGTGTAPQASLLPTAVSFSSMMLGKSSSVQSVTLSNPGTAALSISGVTATGAASGDFAVQNQCGASLDLGASCTLSITFTPTATGTRTAVISVSTNAAGSSPTVTLTGTGTAPQASLSPTAVSFNSTMLGKSSSAQGVTLSNPGTAALSISGVTVTGAASGDFAVQNQCGASLDPGASCTLSVTFTPAAAGSRSATLNITTNATGSAPSVVLSGVGADFSMSASTGSGTAFTVAPGQPATFQTTLVPGGVQGTISLSCAGAPAQATCQVSPGTASLDGVTPVNVTVSVQTTAPSGIAFRTPQAPSSPKDHGGRYGAALLILVPYLVCLSAGGFGKRGSRRLAPLMLLTALALGCGGGGQVASVPSPSQPGTPAGTYILTVTATSQSISHTITLTLTVS